MHLEISLTSQVLKELKLTIRTETKSYYIFSYTFIPPLNWLFPCKLKSFSITKSALTMLIPKNKENLIFMRRLFLLPKKRNVISHYSLLISNLCLNYTTRILLKFIV